MTNPCHLLNHNGNFIPPEIIKTHIVPNLPIRDLKSLAQTSKAMNTLVQVAFKGATNQDLIRMIEKKNLPAVKKLIHLTDPTERNNLAIRWACLLGALEIVKELLNDPKVDPSGEYNYAIRWASEGGHAEIVRELLKDARVNPAAADHESLRMAVKYHHTKVVTLLLKDPRVAETAPQEIIIKNLLREL